MYVYPGPTSFFLGSCVEIREAARVVTGHRSSPEIAERVKTPLVFLYHDLRPSEVEIR